MVNRPWLCCAMNTMRALPPDDRLKKLTSAYLEYAFSRPGPIVIAHREVGIRLRPDMHESIQAIFTEIRDMIQTCINEGVASGIFRNVNLPLFMFVVAGMYDHIVNQLHVLANLNIDGSGYGLQEPTPYSTTANRREYRI